ncbi:MAG: hypothetical protein IT374_03450 [Polyangiaceae bacterium]|nr:hypothetical protein [Polyangiaceae bacterium]
MDRTLALSADLSRASIVVAVGLAALGIALLGLEVRGRRESRWLVLATGAAAALLSLVAILRPASVRTKSARVGARVTVLVDRSRSMLLPGLGGTRDEVGARALAALSHAAKDARITVSGFGEGPASPVGDGPPSFVRSDLGAAVLRLLDEPGEPPAALVVVSDGRLDASRGDRELTEALSRRRIPLSAVAVATDAPRDASVLKVSTSGAAVAHQATPMTIEVACAGLSCDAVPYHVRELLDGAAPQELASGTVSLSRGAGSVDVPITLERAGPRLVEVSIDAPSGDAIPDNDRRTLVVDVTRERVRLLHVAGRPTYDVRALRNWLKSNASVDVIAFFILRSDRSEVTAPDSELALIRFPVDELFTTELPTFDAVVLQDFDAVPYMRGEMSKYLRNLAEYVERGGGLVMVGGPGSFSDGGYAGSDLARVLPVKLEGRRGGDNVDQARVAPRVTTQGAAAPMLAPVRALLGGELPTMPGANIVGDARDGALVLWEHPTRVTSTGKPMPLLSLVEHGDGRSIALGLDGAHRLGFGEVAARAAGRGHGALWDGLLGWLMRDPRFEPAQVELVAPCLTGRPTKLRVVPLPGTTGDVVVDLVPATESPRGTVRRVAIPPGAGSVEVDLGALEPGGYMARVKVGDGGGATRRAIACERGGDEWADPRPDEARLRALAAATSGEVVRATDAARLSLPAAAEVISEMHVSPLAPAWAWTLLATLALGAHWIARRRGGLS